MIIVIDNTSTSKRFLSKLVKYLTKHGIPHTTIRTLQQLQAIPKPKIKGFILSGSARHVPEVNAEQYLLNAATLMYNVPVLGICFGAQFIHMYHDGHLKRLSKHHCRHFPVNFDDTMIEAKFCNTFVVQNVATSLRVTGTYDVERETYACAFQHVTKPIYGVLFHPEDHVKTHHILDSFIKRCLP